MDGISYLDVFSGPNMKLDMKERTISFNKNKMMR
jgi:hypothetical protein